MTNNTAQQARNVYDMTLKQVRIEKANEMIISSIVDVDRKQVFEFD